MLYTLSIKYGSTADPLTEEVKDIKCDYEENTKEFKDWQRRLRQRVFQEGFSVTIQTGQFEFISPFRIHTAYLTRQSL